jgi:hypothetical protein
MHAALQNSKPGFVAAPMSDCEPFCVLRISCVMRPAWNEGRARQARST